MSESKTTYWGYAGHLIVASDCQFHICTTTKNYIISTVGDYRPKGRSGGMETLGSGDKSFFETYVFPYAGRAKECGCCPDAEDWCEIDGERYATAVEANAGHAAYVEKYKKEKKHVRKY